MNKISAIGKGKSRGRDRQRGAGLLDVLSKVAKSSKLGSTLAKQIPGLTGKVAGDLLANLGYGKKATSQRRKRDRLAGDTAKLEDKRPKSYIAFYTKQDANTKKFMDYLEKASPEEFEAQIVSLLAATEKMFSATRDNIENRVGDRYNQIINMIRHITITGIGLPKGGNGKNKRGQKGKGFLADIAGVLGGMIPGIGRFASPLIQSGIEHLGLGKAQKGCGQKTAQSMHRQAGLGVVPVGSFRASATRIPKRAAGPHVDMIGGKLSRGGIHRQTGYGIGATSLSQSLPSMGVQGFKKPSTGPRF